MHRRYRNCFAGVSFAALVFSAVCGANAQKIGVMPPVPTEKRMVAGEVLVRLRPAASALRLSLMGAVQTVASNSAFVKIKLKPNVTIDAALRQLRTLPEVQCAASNYIRSFAVNDPEFVMNNQYALPKIQLDQAWGAWKPVKQIVIGIVDTGINSDHPDLTNMMLRKPDGTLIGYNAITNTEITGPSDDHGHGTFCAGEADAETNNGIGIASFAYTSGTVSPRDYIKLVPLKMLDSNGHGTDEDLLQAISEGLERGVNVFSMSLGDTMQSDAIDAAAQDIWNAGAILVAAAGNYNTNQLFYPAASPEAISVAATDTNDLFAGFSNYGDWVNVAAPGVNIRSTTRSGGYDNFSGTSMACPLVAGMAAFLWAQNPTLSNTELRSKIFSTSFPLTGQSKIVQYGRINVRTAQLAVKSPPLSGKVLLNGWRRTDNTPYHTGNFVRVFVFAPNSAPLLESNALAFADVPLDERGVYALPSGIVPDGTYRVGIKPLTAPGLAKLIPGNVTLSAANPPLVADLTVKLGDGTHDGRVDVADLLLIIQHYNQRLGMSNYLADADINGDGADEVGDLLLILTNYNQAADFFP